LELRQRVHVSYPGELVAFQVQSLQWQVVNAFNALDTVIAEVKRLKVRQ